MHTRRDLRKASMATREKQIDLKRRQHGVSYRFVAKPACAVWRTDCRCKASVRNGGGDRFFCFGIRES